jgi:hypothetical protein
VKPLHSIHLSRIAVAVALSILLHSLFLLNLPHIEWKSPPAPLAQLQAQLVALPKLASKPPARPKIKRPLPPPLPSSEPLITPPPETSPTPDSLDETTSAVAAVPAEASAVEVSQTIDLTPTTDEDAVAPPLLPKHAQLDFIVRYGSGTFQLGEVNHVLENIDGRYTLQAEIQTTGLTKIFKNFHLSQISSGSVSRQGLRPDSYSETRSDKENTQQASAHFDWETHKVHFSNGSESPIDEHAQDMLSLPYHLSQQPMNVENIPISLSNGKNIKQYSLTVGEEETISTAMGELRTIVLHKTRGDNEEGLTIWLALEYRLLPVKILYLDKFGEITANMVITDIRVSDE